jgi:hypothetical protein
MFATRSEKTPSFQQSEPQATNELVAAAAKNHRCSPNDLRYPALDGNTNHEATLHFHDLSIPLKTKQLNFWSCNFLQ